MQKYDWLTLGALTDSAFSKTQLVPELRLVLSGCIPAYPSRGKGALGPLLSALAGARKRETPSSNVTESPVDNTLSTFKMNVTSCGNIYLTF